MIKLLISILLLPIFANAQTRNIVPRTNNAGNIGLSTLTWSGVYGTQFYGGGSNLTGIIQATATGNYPLTAANVTTIPTLTGDVSNIGNAVTISSVPYWNAKQAAGNYITSLTGGVTASGPGASAATVVTNANLTGPITSVGNATTIVGPVPAAAIDLSTVTTAINLKLSSPTVTGNTGDVLTITNGSFSWQPAPSAAGLTYMFTSSASAISGYTQLVSAVNFMPSQRSTVTVTNPVVNQYISSRCTNVGYPGVSGFPAGTWSNYITLLASNPPRFKVKPEVYLRTAAGVERDFVETFEESEYITASELPYTFHGHGVATNTLVTDLLCVKLKVTTVDGNGTLTIYSDGTGTSYTGARIEGPSVAASVANFVPYSGSVKPLDMGVHSITASSITATGAVTVSSVTVSGTTGMNMYALGSSSITINTATYDIPVSTGKPYWFINLSSSTTLSFSNVVAGMDMTFAIKQSSDSKTITWPTSTPNVRWPSSGNTLSTTTLKIDMVNIACPFSATECFGVLGPTGY